MDTGLILKELRRERDKLTRAIDALEKITPSTLKPRGRPRLKSLRSEAPQPPEAQPAPRSDS